MAILVTCPSCGTRFRARDKHRNEQANCPKCNHSLVLDGPPVADDDVFISYSHRDEQAANAVCAGLERQRLRCWMAPRNILPGADWAGAIVDAIGNCRIFVLIYSSHANES